MIRRLLLASFSLALLAYATAAYAADDGPMESAGGDSHSAAPRFHEGRFQLAQLTVTGAGSGGFGGGGPPPPAYTPEAVEFWPEAAALITTAVNMNGGTDTTHGIYTFRVRMQKGTFGNQSSTADWRSSTLFGTQGTGSCSAEGCEGAAVNADFAGGADGQGATFKSTFGGANDGIGGLIPNPGLGLTKTNAYFNSTWYTVTMLVDTSGIINTKKAAIWLNGTLLCSSPATCGNDSGLPFSTFWNGAARGFFINGGNRSSGQTSGYFDISDMSLDTTTAIPAACLANFPADATCTAIVKAAYNAGPVNLGTTSSDCLVFTASYGGGTPDYCFRGDATHFLLNTGGAANPPTLVNLVGSSPLTVGNGTVKLFNAAYPQGGEPPDRPFHVWSHPSYPAHTATSTSFSTANTSAASQGNNGDAIKTGDLILLSAVWTYTAIDFNNAPSTPSGWTLLSTSTSPNPANGSRTTYAIWYQVATADYIGANLPWVTGNPFVDPPSVPYISQGTTNLKSLEYNFSLFRSTNGTVVVGPSDAVAYFAPTGTAWAIAPAVTTSKAVGTLVHICMYRNGNAPITTPSGDDLRMAIEYNVGNTAGTTISDKKTTASGVQAAVTFPQPSAGVGDRGYCATAHLTNN